MSWLRTALTAITLYRMLAPAEPMPVGARRATAAEMAALEASGEVPDGVTGALIIVPTETWRAAFGAKLGARDLGDGRWGISAHRVMLAMEATRQGLGYVGMACADGRPCPPGVTCPC